MQVKFKFFNFRDEYLHGKKNEFKLSLSSKKKSTDISDNLNIKNLNLIENNSDGNVVEIFPIEKFELIKENENPSEFVFINNENDLVEENNYISDNYDQEMKFKYE